MRFLLFSDLHCSVEAATHLLKLSVDADVMIGAGDFSIKRKGIADTIEILRRATCPAVMVPGNGESIEELVDACAGWDQAHVLHGNGATIESTSFFGIGGGIPTTPFGAWSYDFTEDEAFELLSPMQSADVMVTHSPPWQCVDVDGSGEHRGSPTIRAAIERIGPLLVVCGHVHDSWESTEKIGNSTVINAGPRGMWFEL